MTSKEWIKLYLTVKNELIQTKYPDVNYIVQEDLDEIDSWDNDDINIIIEQINVVNVAIEHNKVMDYCNHPVVVDSYICPWCIITDYKFNDTSMACSQVCNYATRHKNCNNDDSDWAKITNSDQYDTIHICKQFPELITWINQTFHLIDEI